MTSETVNGTRQVVSILKVLQKAMATIVDMLSLFSIKTTNIMLVSQMMTLKKIVTTLKSI